jgi:hypothetical protein
MRFTAPKLEEVQTRAAEIELPAREAEKFFCYYASKGWKVGRAPMKQWKIALSGWKLRWEERNGQNGVSPTTLAILRQKELEEVQGKMNSIRNSYSEHQGWAADDLARWSKLIARKKELKKLLGMEV